MLQSLFSRGFERHLADGGQKNANKEEDTIQWLTNVKE